MDILSHSLWAGLGGTALARHRPITRAQLAAAIALAAIPDVGHLLPIVAWAIAGDGTWATISGYALAVPGAEPWLPPAVQMWSHTLHCVLHSAIVAVGVTLIAAAWQRWWLWPLAGWWSHIVIDVFTHSRDYYPSPVLYPITEHGFDGIAWPTPWFIATNYVMLAVVALWLQRRRLRSTLNNGRSSARVERRVGSSSQARSARRPE